MGGSPTRSSSSDSGLYGEIDATGHTIVISERQDKTVSGLGEICGALLQLPAHPRPRRLHGAARRLKITQGHPR